MFKVVEFHDEDGGGELSVVREETWLTPCKSNCLWPPHTISSKFNKCLVNKTVPDKLSWTLYPVKRLFYETDDLLKARQKCKKAESESELATDLEDIGTKKRKRKIPVFYSDNESDGENETYHKINYPKVLTLQDFNVDSPMPSSPYSVDTLRNSPAFSIPGQPLILTEINSSLSKIANYLGEITSALKEIQQSQREVLSRLSTTSAAIPERLPDNVSLPLKSEADITSLEVWLENDENKELMINYLTYIGGNKIGPITRRILERVIQNDLARRCNWTGKNNKIPLKDLNLTKVIIGAVRKNKIAEKETDHGITEILLSWFRFAKDRDGGRESRRATSN